MKRVLTVITAACVSLAILGACARTTDRKKSDDVSTKTEQVEQKPKEESIEKEKEEQKEERKEEQNEESSKKEQTSQIVSEPTHYTVFRCDYREGAFGDVQVMTIDTADFSADYADLLPDGSFSFSVSGVDYTTKLTLGGKEKHLYSGIEDAEVERLLLGDKEYATVGSVDVECFYVDNYILLDMVTQSNNKTVFATYYLWKEPTE